jgi:hypothetical protein
MGDRSSFLFAMPGFFCGMGSVLDLAGNGIMVNSSSDEDEADAIAIRQDWYAVGDDLRKAISDYRGKVTVNG